MKCSVWAMCGVGTAIASFVMHAMPYLQLLALVFSVAASIKALREPRKGK